jgi:hypothetical protein
MHIPRLREKLIQSKLRSDDREEHNQMCRQIFMKTTDGTYMQENEKYIAYGYDI